MDNCPFSGKPCGDPKVTHITEVDKGDVRDLHFCKSCTERYKDGESPPIPVTVNSGALSLLTQFIGLLSKKKKKDQPEPPERCCPSCKSSLKDITATGQLGCGECYTYFGEEMNRVLEKIHKNTVHDGKRTSHKLAKEELLASLQAKMSIAIKLENYEVASVLRDQIKELSAPEPIPPSSVGQ